MPPLPPPPPPEMTPSDDYSFTPSDDRLLAFLRRKLAGEPLPAAAAAAHFHDADIYAAEPADLTAAHEPAPAKKGEGDSWFFFTHVRPKSSRDTRKSRQVAGGVGTWHSERAPRAVLGDEGDCVGHFQYFSYKIKTGKNCSERTQWYMVEFSHDDHQEGNHEHIHGGKPMLVLCKIYKAHSSSRSSSVRKRKTTDEHLNQVASPLNQVSSPVKAKRRLFDSHAPISSAAASQGQVGSIGWYELAAQLESLHSGIGMESKPSQDEAGPEALQEQNSSRGCYEFAAPVGSLHSGIGMESKPSQDEAEPEASQEQNSSRGWYEFAAPLESLHSGIGMESKPSQDGEAKSEEPEASQENLCSAAWCNLPDKSNATLVSASRPELEPLQGMVSKSIHRFLIPGTEASQVEWIGDEAKSEEPEALQEKLNPRAWCNLQDKSNDTIDSAFKPELGPLQDKVSESIHRFWIPGKQASQVEWLDEEAKSEEPEASQGKLNSRAWCNLQDKCNDTMDSAFRPEIGQLQDIVSESTHRFWTPRKHVSQVELLGEEAKSEEPETQGKLNSRTWCNLQDKSSATLDSAVRPELEPLQDKASDSIHRFWTPETGASQVDRATMNCSFLMASSAPPMPVDCASGALSSTSWIGNDIMTSCSSELGWFLGAPAYNELGGTAGGGFTDEPGVCSMPLTAVPPAAASWFLSGPNIWSC